MRKSKQNRKKNQKGTNLKVSPLKRYKKQIKRMKNRLKEPEGEMLLHTIYKARLERAETVLKNWDKEQEQKKAAALTAKLQGKKV